MDDVVKFEAETVAYSGELHIYFIVSSDWYSAVSIIQKTLHDGEKIISIKRIHPTKVLR